MTHYFAPHPGGSHCGAHAFRMYMSTATTRRWSSAAGSRPSFEKMDPTWVSTVFGERNSRSQILGHALRIGDVECDGGHARLGDGGKITRGSVDLGRTPD